MDESTELPPRRRSCLTVPGNSERMLRKAAGVAADQVVIDLEDAVPPDAKTSETRSLVSWAIAELDWGATETAVRVNGVGSAWFEDDLEALLLDAAAIPAALVIPKVEAPSDVQAVVDAVAGAPSLRIEALVESALGIVNVEAIASSSDRLGALVFGPGDYAASLGQLIDTDRLGGPETAPYPRARLVNAAKAFGLQAIDGPYGNFQDHDGLRAAATAAAEAGFDGKWAIHPSQVEVCNAAFTPSEGQIAHARAILDRLLDGGGASALDGALVDEATRRAAVSILARARAGRGGQRRHSNRASMCGKWGDADV